MQLLTLMILGEDHWQAFADPSLMYLPLRITIAKNIKMATNQMENLRRLHQDQRTMLMQKRRRHCHQRVPKVEVQYHTQRMTWTAMILLVEKMLDQEAENI